MKNLPSKIILILVILGLCAWCLAARGLRLGKDLQGGVSLVYAVNFGDDAAVDKNAVLTQTITVLKERINPNGILDISMLPLGADRIEIVMPLANDEVKALKKAYETQLESLRAFAEIPADDLDEAVRTNTAIERYAGESGTERARRVEVLQKAYNDLQAARTALNESQAANAGPDAVAVQESAVAAAELGYDDAREAVLRLSLDRTRLARTVGLSTDRQADKDDRGFNKRDPVTGEVVMKESQRATALSILKDQYKHLSSGLDAVVAAYDEYQSKRKGLDDPEDLMRLMRGAGVLEFYIAVQNASPEGVNIEDLRRQLDQNGPEHIDSSAVRWFPVNDLKQWYDTPAELRALDADPASFFASRNLVAARHDAVVYLLLYTSPTKSMTHTADSRWTVESTGVTADDLGRPAVSFRLDASGGGLMARLTGPHVGQPMAIVLDGQVYTAPRLNSQIGISGVIEGDFPKAELDYLIRVLASGALEARLSAQPIAITTLGPSLGEDNLQRGLWAFVLSVVVTVTIMLVYYFFAGFIANVALMANAIIIFGVMALIDGTFTLPGLAGMALSIAMAVDANVLIYERIREEVVNNKEDLRTAIRLGYQRAMSAIVDGNIAHLITCVVLLYTATTEVKGFALTMILGVVATLFSALFITRVLFTLYTEYLGATSLPMLPTVFPGIHKSLEPHIDWISKRYIFFTISTIAVVASLTLVAMQGANMLDTEFRGGVAMTMETRMARTGEPQDEEGRLLLSRSDVETKVHAIGARSTVDTDPLKQLENASVLTVGETVDFQASRFQIKVANPPGAEPDKTIAGTVVEAIIREFGDDLDVNQPLAFRGAGSVSHVEFTFRINASTLGKNINRPEVQDNVASFRGGVAVLIDNVSPPAQLDDVEDRIKTMRSQPDFADCEDRSVRVVAIDRVDSADPSKGVTSFAVLVGDPDLNHTRVTFERWDAGLAQREWTLVSKALERPASLEQVSEFSSAMAESLRANAVVAVVLSLLGMLAYIWIRFGSLRYSAATVIAVTHNVIICLGALALTNWLAGTKVASWLLLDEFRIDLNVIAALLTIIGYSLNDTIVIMDRIRENRGKRLLATPEIVNNSINQTFSRTVLTGGSTIIASVILYVLGGTGIQPFAFTFLIGLVVGTYSSVTIAAPLVIGGSQAEALPAGEPRRFLPETAAGST